MASKTTSIPRFLLPQSGSMWRAATRSAAFFSRPLHIEVGQVTVVRHASSQVARPRPRAAMKSSAATGLSARRTAYTKAKAPGAAAQQPAKGTVPKPGPVDATSAAGAPARPAAATDPSKPIVLEKPERFNPPSHGSRLPRSRPRHYGGSLTAEEAKAQSQKSYPGLPPPPNTWAHWFLHSRGIHTFITLGTLTVLACYTFAANFRATSEFADLIPPSSEFWRHPFQYMGVCVDVLRMHEEHESARTAEKRRRRVEDVNKRNEYRLAHGLEPANSGLFGARGVRVDNDPAASSPPAATVATATTTPAAESLGPVLPDPEATFAPEGGRKKFLGIF